MAASDITLEEAPTENPGTIDIIQCYDAPLRAAEKRIKMYIGHTTNPDDCLVLAVHAMNWTVEAEGLCPILLVFGAITRHAQTKTPPSQQVQAKPIYDGMKAAQTEQAKRRLAFSTCQPSGTKAVESSEKLRKLLAGSSVLVYRVYEKKWKGLFKLLSVEGETAVVQIDRGRWLLHSHCVIPWIASHLDDDKDTKCTQKTG